MDLYVLNLDLDEETVIDSYGSLIWTDRFNEYGDFEIYTAMTSDMLKYIKQDYYIRQNNSEHVMIIEKIQINSDIENGNNLTVTGRSLESILDRRIVWGQKTISGNLQNGIKTLLNENVISPSNSKRKIENFIFKASTDPAITKLTIEAQYTGDNLYEVINKICTDQDIGFKITIDDSKRFVFQLYSGSDRSYDQISRPYVVFSPKFDNLISSNYIESRSSWKNVTLVGGEGEGTARRYTAVGNVSGLDRRETFTDARDISSDTNDGTTLTDDQYIAQLRQRGKETLSENKDIMSFEGQAETTIMFKYGVDFFNGDIVQVSDDYGHEAKARILEIVMSEDQEGILVYPTFSMIEPKSLPENYLELTYIESSGTQYIDTGFKPNQDTRVICKISGFPNTKSGQAVFGSRSSDYANDSFVFLAYQQSYRSDYGSNRANAGTDVNYTGTFTIDKNENLTMLNSERLVTNLTGKFSSNQNLYLFACNTGGSKSLLSNGLRIYSCKIYNGDMLVRDFIPCKNDSEKVGLYDLIDGKFYSNSGTGSFVIE